MRYALLLLLAACSSRNEEAAPQPIAPIAAEQRVVVASGTLTETVFALGAGDRLVGVDTSSVYPVAETERLPKVGYQRQLSAEGVLSLRPTLLLASEEAGPPEVLAQLRSAGVEIRTIPHESTKEGAAQMIRALGVVFDRGARAEELVRAMNAEIDAVAREIADRERPSVLFVYARGPSTVNVAGTGTGANTILAMAGARNAITDVEGFRPITAEAVVVAQPDMVLFLARGLESLGGVDGALRLPGIAETPAGRARRVVALDDLLALGFGPRTGEAVRALASELHPARGTTAQR